MFDWFKLFKLTLTHSLFSSKDGDNSHEITELLSSQASQGKNCGFTNIYEYSQFINFILATMINQRS